MLENMFDKGKYVSKFIHYQKLHFCTPDILTGVSYAKLYPRYIFERVHFGLLHQVTRFTFLRYHLIYVQITLYLNTEIKF